MSLNVKALLILLLLSVGAVGGFLNAQDHYQPLLDAANRDLGAAITARNNLGALATEQGQKLGELVLRGSEREELAKKAQTTAHEEAQPVYAAANRLLRERSGGEPCAAATAVIDQELFGQ